MKALVLGLGSMGKRRIRNLKHLGVNQIAGFDLRNDRIKEAQQTYDILVFDSFTDALEKFSPTVAIISVSPESHAQYIEACISRGIHCFIEASVTDKDKIFKLASIAESSDVVVAPSCTMTYYPGPKRIKELVKANRLGKVINFTYYSGQYLPDWHPWENIEDYYVSKRETGGCREIVPFELTWLNDIFGYPDLLSSTRTKISDLKADIDDIYQICLRYPGKILGSLTVDVISKAVARREMFINLERGQIVFSSHENCVRYIEVGDTQWTVEDLPVGTVEDMYINPEEPYIQEISDFIDACRCNNQKLFPNTLLRDWSLLNLLSTIDQSSQTF